MKKFKLSIFLIVASLLLILLNACDTSHKGNDNKDISGDEPKVLPIDTKKDDNEIVDIDITEVDEIVTIEEPVNNYKVILETDSIIHLDEIGVLNVWIGSEDVEYIGLDGMTKDAGTIPKRLGQYAKISPDAAGFEVIGDSDKCYKIDNSGSNVSFSLKPINEGDFFVSATVEMHKAEDCSDAPAPQFVQRLSVKVKVDKVQELSDILLENFKNSQNIDVSDELGKIILMQKLIQLLVQVLCKFSLI